MGYLVHVGATVICAHAGQAQPMVPNLRVKVSNQQIVTQSNVVYGCGMHASEPSNREWSMCERAVDSCRNAGKGGRFASNSSG